MKTLSWLIVLNPSVLLPFFLECEELFVNYTQRNDLCMDEFGRWPLHLTCTMLKGPKRMELLRKLLPLKIPFDKKVFETSSGPNESTLEACKRLGISDVYEVLNMSTMGDSLKASVLKERDRIEALLATSSTFFMDYKSFEKGKDGFENNAMMEQISKSLEKAFEQRTPISDDIFFLVWRWNTKINGGKPLVSSLWKALEKTLREVLRIPVDEFSWICTRGPALSFGGCHPF